MSDLESHDEAMTPSNLAAAGDVEHIKALPREVGALLIVLGLGGVLLPGPVGSPFLLMGGVVLWPRVFERFELLFEKRFPVLHRQSMRQLRRFIDDLENRYPTPPVTD